MIFALQKNTKYIGSVFPAWLGLDTFSEQAGFALKKKRRMDERKSSFFFRETKKRCPFFLSISVALIG